MSPTERFPRFRLLFPIAVPSAFIAVMAIAEQMGHQWNIHGDGMLMVFSIVVSALGAFVFEIFALQKAIRALRNFERTRTPMNLLCTGASITYIGGVIFYIAWFYQSVART